MLASLGVSYKSTSMASLDLLCLRDAPGFYKILRGLTGVKGAMVLQTCNRVEFYLDTEDQTDVTDRVLWHWALETKFKLGELSRIVDRHQGDDLVAHLVRLGSGLESMMLGEPQILGQLRNALLEAKAQQAASPALSQLFEKAIQAAAMIRQRTGIGRGTVSLGSAAIKLAEEILGPIQNSNVLLIGTGQVGMLAMKALNARRVKNITVAGRTRHRTDSFCKTYGGTPIDLRQIEDQLSTTDLALVATRASNHILTRQMVASAARDRKKSKLVVVDLSSPRNVSADVEEVEGVSVKTLEDLRGTTEAGMAKRRELAKQAEPLVRQSVEEVSRMDRREKAEPVVADLFQRANVIRAEELGKALSRLTLSAAEQRVLENMSRSMVEKILGPPTLNLRRAAEKGKSEVLVAAGQIFGDE